MRGVWIELSGREVAILKETIDELTHDESLKDTLTLARIKAIEGILFGAGP